ncbi:MAG: amidohydrolase [Bacteroidales bacterium]
MTEDLTITIIQAPLRWEDQPGNLANFGGLMRPLQGIQDLILLPEMFNTGFSMNPPLYAEPMDGPSIAWLMEQAAFTGSVIAATLMIVEDGSYFNRSVWVYPDGTLGYYDKRHLFRMGNEGEHFSKGGTKRIFRVKGWKIMPLTCYDLRFPVWSMNSYAGEEYRYDLLYYLSNWPAARTFHWRSLLTARAIENQAYVAGVNRTGKDGHGLDHSGHSLMLDPWGNILADAGEAETFLLKTTLSHHKLTDYRKKFFIAPDWSDDTEE